MKVEAETAYRTALSGSLPTEVEWAAWRQLSLLFKRQGRREEAAVIWHRLAESDDTGDVYAHVELAKHYEWHTGDLSAATTVTRQAMALLENAAPGGQRGGTWDELAHRLRRLERKMVRMRTLE